MKTCLASSNLAFPAGGGLDVILAGIDSAPLWSVCMTPASASHFSDVRR
jgi:hypothetical protein